MIKLTRALDSIWRVSVAKTPAQIEAEEWLRTHPEEFVDWSPQPSDYTYSDFPDAAEAPRRSEPSSGADANWPESVGHPAEFHPAFTAAGYRLNLPRWNNGEAPTYSRSTAPPIEGSLSGSHTIWPSHDSTTPWTGLNTYGPWSGGVGHYATPEDAIRGAEEDERRYVDMHKRYVAERDRA